MYSETGSETGQSHAIRNRKEYGGWHAKSWTALIAALLFPSESDPIESDLGALSR